MHAINTNRGLMSPLAITDRIAIPMASETPLIPVGVPDLSEGACERKIIDGGLARLERDARCVWRAVRLMFFFSAFSVAGLGHSTVLLPFWPQTLSQYLMQWTVKVFCTLGLASFSCAIVFAAVGLVYRRDLKWHRAESQRLATESDSPEPAPLIALPIGGGPAGSLADGGRCGAAGDDCGGAAALSHADAA